MTPRIRFCGAAETVTGSRHLISLNKRRVLVDCGLFQGKREIRDRNWTKFPVEPASLDCVIVTHAHLDHIGYLPRLVAEGYHGPIYATPATIALARLSLPDSGRLNEEEAAYRNSKGLTRHDPALPLYTEHQAYASLKQFEKVPYEAIQQGPAGCTWRFLPAGHILGSAFVELHFPNGERILLSGDLGRYGRPIIVDPTPVAFAEYLVVESTYGDRNHAHEDPEAKLEAILNRAWQDGACVLVPSFAIGRTQELLYYIKRLEDAGRIPRIPIFVDSPMASSATLMYFQHDEEHDQEMLEGVVNHQNPIAPEGVTWVRDREESKELNTRQGPFMVISGSGMCQGGRIVHHLLNRASDANTVIVFTGYQAEGTRGRAILEGAQEITIMGQTVPVRARVEKLNSLSAHADQGEILRWLGFFRTPPKRTYLVHGEPRAQQALKARIEADLGWRVEIPRHLESFDLA